MHSKRSKRSKCRQIVRPAPQTPARNALEVLGDLYRTLDDETADALADAVNTTRKGKAAKLTQTGRDSDFRIQNLWLAAQAVQRKFNLFTANARDFQDIPDLKFMAVGVP